MYHAGVNIIAIAELCSGAFVRVSDANRRLDWTQTNCLCISLLIVGRVELSKNLTLVQTLATI